MSKKKHRPARRPRQPINVKPKQRPFATAQVCPLGIDMWGNYPDGSLYLYSLNWDEIAVLAKKRGKRIAGKGEAQRLASQMSDMLSLGRPKPAAMPEPPLFPWDHNIDTR